MRAPSVGRHIEIQYLKKFTQSFQVTHAQNRMRSGWHCCFKCFLPHCLLSIAHWLRIVLHIVQHSGSRSVSPGLLLACESNIFAKFESCQAQDVATFLIISHSSYRYSTLFQDNRQYGLERSGRSEGRGGNVKTQG